MAARVARRACGARSEACQQRHADEGSYGGLVKCHDFLARFARRIAGMFIAGGGARRTPRDARIAARRAVRGRVFFP